MFLLSRGLESRQKTLIERSLKGIFGGVKCRIKYGMEQVRLLLYLTLINNFLARRAAKMCNTDRNTGTGYVRKATLSIYNNRYRDKVNVSLNKCISKL